jgi:hypothetical protein
VAGKEDANPCITLSWKQPQPIRTISLFFDVDYDHAMESVQFGHHDNAMPFCVKAFQIKDDQGTVIHTESDNHQGRCCIELRETVTTSSLTIDILETRDAPAALFGVRCYA